MANLMETAVKAGNFSTLIQAAEAAQLVDIIKNSDSLTIFAPTDEAFSKLPKSTLDGLLEDIPKLKKIVTYHLAFGDVRSDDLIQIDEAPTVEGSILAIESSESGIKVNHANVLKTDILADNGVIHVIDEVLIPAIMGENITSNS
jgi:uncharacterized surface protein with fasciclin (FAS1) repeats